MTAPPLVDKVLRTPGRPLDTATRAFFEPRFGRDLSKVRVHTDAASSASARAVEAQAYTVGQDVVFGKGQYAPTTNAGRKLLAHELTHTIQQSEGNGGRLARVPTRKGIQTTPPRYDFSTNCGWIDWSHATGRLAQNLINRVAQASAALKAKGATPEQGDVSTPQMDSREPLFGTILSAASVNARLVRPLNSQAEIDSVALSLFKKLSIVFETQQEWTQLIGRSSFAQEDLPSNLIGFYRGAKGYSRADINKYCGSVGSAASLQEYDRNSNFVANRSFAPVGAPGTWPKELSSIDDSKADALYEINSIATRQGGTGFTYCPIYRVEGVIDESDFILVSWGGVNFTAKDNLRVVPTYRFKEDTHSRYGHANYLEVEPYGDADAKLLKKHDIEAPLYVAHPVLKCLSSHGKDI